MSADLISAAGPREKKIVILQMKINPQQWVAQWGPAALPNVALTTNNTPNIIPETVWNIGQNINASK